MKHEASVLHFYFDYPGLHIICSEITDVDLHLNLFNLYNLFN